MGDQITELAELLSSTSLTDEEFKDGDLWEKHVLPITRPFLQAVMERLQDRVREELETTFKIRYKVKPTQVKKTVTTRDSAQVRIPVKDRGIKGFDVGTYLGVTDYLENELVWGARWWGTDETAPRVEEPFKRIMHEGEEVRAVKNEIFSGKHCYLIRSLSHSELRSRDERDLIEEVAADLFDVYKRVLKVAEEIDEEDGEGDGNREDMFDGLGRYFAAQGFHLTPHQLATFYTALKTKGFVILSGLSGTGKTKLAQLFTELMLSPEVETLEEPEVSEVDIRIRVQPYMLKYARMIIPKGYWKLIDVPPSGETVEIEVSFDGRKQNCRFGHAAYSGTDYLALYFRGEAKKWFVSSFEEGDTVALEPIIDEEEGNLIGFRLSRPKVRRVTKREENSRFVPVRPDWRDSKSLLGYYNPLSGQFESTEFLQFLLRACDNYRASLHELNWEADHPNATTLLAEPKAFAVDRIRLGQLAFDGNGRIVAQGAFEFHVNEGRQLSLPGRIGDLEPFRNAAKIYALELDRVYPHFIILDEMNLARVEYYFADFLSVLESGRSGDGWTKEAITLHDFRSPVEDAEGNPIPAQIKLPPNFYFVGTVNVDETTYMFSPKVLDRAFTIECTEVDFERYPAEEGEGLSDDELENLRQQLLKDFTQGGKFAIVDKGAIAEFAARQPKYRKHLDSLKVLLQPYDLHFAYRVFDEIVAFLANAEDSPVFAGFDGLDDAFDTSVLMKVLPKFHGPRGKLGKPLQALLAWALQPGNPNEGWTKLKPRLDDETKKWMRWQESLDTEGLEPFLDELGFAYKRTARKALRMLRSLYTTGFASFA